MQLFEKVGKNLKLLFGSLTTDEATKRDFEESVMEMTSNIFTETLLGVRLDAQLLYTFLHGVWGKGKYVHSLTH